MNNHFTVIHTDMDSGDEAILSSERVFLHKGRMAVSLKDTQDIRIESGKVQVLSASGVIVAEYDLDKKPEVWS